jgi:Carboxypeptidase regulatory-like domain
MRGGRRWARTCVWLLGMGIASPVAAQIGAGALAVNVVDQAGAAVPGATVTVIAVGTRLSRTVVTGRDGAYSVQGLAPGSYQVRVESSGFRPLIREGIQLATGEIVRLDLQLEVGGLTEAITVTADAPLIRSEASGLGQVIDNKKVVDLPLNGRSFVTLAGLVPVVALPPGSSFPRINGGRPRTSEYLFDGI